MRKSWNKTTHERRQAELAGSRPNKEPDLMENFPQGREGPKTEERIVLKGKDDLERQEKATLCNQISRYIEPELKTFI